MASGLKPAMMPDIVIFIPAINNAIVKRPKPQPVDLEKPLIQKGDKLEALNDLDPKTSHDLNPKT